MSEETNVPSYGELGKQARDVFRSGYAYDLFKLKIIAPPKAYGLEGDATVDLKSWKAGCSILAKYDTGDYGIFSAKYIHDGPLLVGEYNLNGKISEGVDVAAGYSVNLSDNFQTAKLGGKFYNSLLHASCSLTKDMDRGPDFLATLVVKLSNFLVGYQAGYDTSASRMTKNDVAVAFDASGVGLHLRCIQIPREFGISAVYPVNETVDAALDAKMALSDTSLWCIGAGVACKLDDQCKLRVKFNKDLQLGTSLHLNIPHGIKLTLAFSLDLSMPSSGQHKVGFGIEVQG